MLPEHRVLLEDEPCPVADEMLGKMYRASAHGLNELIATVSPAARALLAVYCYRRAHLASIGLAIAATCEKDDLASSGGKAGAILFERSREATQSLSFDAHATGRRKITLATGPLRQLRPIVDEEDSLSTSAEVYGEARKIVDNKVEGPGK
jgi:hypothetical protein